MDKNKKNKREKGRHIRPVYKYQIMTESEMEGERYRGKGRRIGDKWKRDLEKS